MQIVPGRSHVEEKCVRVLHVVEAFGDIPAVHGDIVAYPRPFKVPSGQFVEFFAGLKCVNASCGTGKPGKSDGKAAGTGSRPQ